jgi:hypothetical protein
VSAFTNDAGYATEAAMNEAVSNINNDLSENYAKKTDIPTVPTNVSEFTNDAGYVTQDDIPTVPTNVSEFENDADYVTRTVMNDYLSDYALNSDIPTKTSQFTNDSGYITSTAITRIEIVEELPENEVPGVLYIVKA